jgi:hypothetical protein
MKDYTVIREFWRNGMLQQVGKVIRMAEKEAKYLAHALEDKAIEVEQKVEAAVKSVRAPKPAAAVVVEAPADGDKSVN